MFFELVLVLFAIVRDYGNEYMTKENKNCTSFKNFAPKLNWNHVNVHCVIIIIVDFISVFMNYLLNLWTRVWIS